MTDGVVGLWLKPPFDKDFSFSWVSDRCAQPRLGYRMVLEGLPEWEAPFPGAPTDIDMVDGETVEVNLSNPVIRIV